jgi:hypothetical protein
LIPIINLASEESNHTENQVWMDKQTNEVKGLDKTGGAKL